MTIDKLNFAAALARSQRRARECLASGNVYAPSALPMYVEGKYVGTALESRDWLYDGEEQREVAHITIDGERDSARFLAIQENGVGDIFSIPLKVSSC